MKHRLGAPAPGAGDSEKLQGSGSFPRRDQNTVGSVSRKASYLPKRENSVPREVLEEEHFSLPLDELGHC